MTSQQPDPQLVALAAAYQQQTQTVRGKVTGFIESLWRSLGIYRDAQRVVFLREVVPVVLGAEQHMATLTSSYLATNRQLVLGGSGTPSPVNLNQITGSATRNDVAPDDVYRRPFGKVWRDLHEGTKPDVAIDHGLTLAKNLAVTDLQRTKTLTSQQLLEDDDKVTWYERILEGEKSCGLCIVASTLRYHKAKLLPIHPGCDCGVATHYGDPDDEQMHLPRLQDVHAAIEETFGASSPSARQIPGQYLDGKPLKYRDVLITHEHGELGPVLAVKGQKFTGPTDLS